MYTKETPAAQLESFEPEILDEIPAPKSSVAHVSATTTRKSSHVMPSMTGIFGSARYSRS